MDYQETKINIEFTTSARKNLSDDVKGRVAQILQFYPELQTRTITVGFIRRRSRTLGRAHMAGTRIWLKNGVTNLTIAHELAHLLGKQSEEATDVITYARLPEHLFDDNRDGYIPIKGRDKQKVHSLAIEAMMQRDTGNRRYIKWFKDAMKKERELTSPFSRFFQ